MGDSSLNLSNNLKEDGASKKKKKHCSYPLYTQTHRIYAYISNLQRGLQFIKAVDTKIVVLKDETTYSFRFL
jgi:hypothetical protein